MKTWIMIDNFLNKIVQDFRIQIFKNPEFQIKII